MQNISTQVVKYVVRSSDVISDMRVNVSEQGSERVVWYKERFLAETEIVEHLFESTTSTLLWSIHRPLRGWYIRLRAPSFPPNTYISLLPVPRASPHHTQAALCFSCPTTLPSIFPRPRQLESPSPSRKPTPINTSPAPSSSSANSSRSGSQPPLIAFSPESSRNPSVDNFAISNSPPSPTSPTLPSESASSAPVVDGQPETPTPTSNLFNLPPIDTNLDKTPTAHSHSQSRPESQTLPDAEADPQPSSQSHTYPPPTPPSILVSPPSPKSVHAKLDALVASPATYVGDPETNVLPSTGPPGSSRRSDSSPGAGGSGRGRGVAKLRPVMTEFVLAPFFPGGDDGSGPSSTTDPALNAGGVGGFFARALKAIRNNAVPASPASSFTMSVIPPPPPPPPPSPPLPALPSEIGNGSGVERTSLSDDPYSVPIPPTPPPKPDSTFAPQPPPKDAFSSSQSLPPIAPMRAPTLALAPCPLPSSSPSPPRPVPIPLITYRDTTPYFTFNSTSGLLELDIRLLAHTATNTSRQRQARNETGPPPARSPSPTVSTFAGASSSDVGSQGKENVGAGGSMGNGGAGLQDNGGIGSRGDGGVGVVRDGGIGWEGGGGVDIGFWVAVALVYTEFLGDRESWLAAAGDDWA